MAQKPRLQYKSELEALLLGDILLQYKIIGELLVQLEEDYPDLTQTAANMVKDAVQIEAQTNWVNNHEWGILAMATGTGKSRVAIEECIIRCAIASDSKILLIVPTEKLRDENWKEEFIKWGAESIYNNNVERYCYASISNIWNQNFDLIIADEVHNLTPNNSEFFNQNTADRLIGLTATPPDNLQKIELFKKLHLKIDYEVSLDIAVELRMVSPYEMTVIECRLEDIVKTIPAGTKDKPFLTTEKKAYEYQSKLVNKTFGIANPIKRGAAQKFRRLSRMRFLKDLESTTENVKFILNNFITPDEKTLIFCGGISQANELCQHRFHSKTDDIAFNLFKEGQINKLTCVAALNEGMNIEGITTIIITCPESGDTTITQQIGRGVRFKVGFIAKIIVFVIVDTVSDEWFKKASAGFDQSKIRRIRMANLLNGNQII